MKTKALLLLCAILALAACSNDDNDATLTPTTQTEPTQPITFNLTATHPDDNAATRGWTGDGQTATTRAVKSTWEAGDAIFVFFSGAAAPKHLKMTFDGSAWTSAEYDGATLTAGALGLKNGDTGTMRAVYLPFGSTATVSASGTSFTFSKTYYAYYLTATLAYTVVGNEVSGAFDMTIPDDYVQFFVEDAAATDEAYTLGCDAVIPTGVASIAADGTVTETSDKTAAADMPGYSYSGGYLFSGKLTTYGYDHPDLGVLSYGGYYFAKTKVSDNTRHDYIVTGKTLASHSAVKLPANGNSKWEAVGSGIHVTINYDAGGGLGGSMGWQTCNYGCSKPEELGTAYSFADANAIDGIKMPNKENFQAMIDHCSWTWVQIHGQMGVVVKGTSGFIFLPAGSGSIGYYWTSTAADESQSWLLSYLINIHSRTMSATRKTDKFWVRERYW